MPSWYERAAECRRIAEGALQDDSDARAIEAITQLGDLAADDDASVREVALRSLARVAPRARQQALDVLMVAVDDPKESVRAEAFRALAVAAERGCELAVPLARHEARTEASGSAVRVEALRVLQQVAEVGDWSTFGQLALHAQEQDVALRCAAVQALAALAPPGDARTVAFLAGAEAAFLPQCPDEEAAAALRPHAEGLGSARDPDWQVRVVALTALAHLAPRECQRACDAAGEAARDARWEVRAAAARALRDLAPLGDLEAACVLAEQCKDPSFDVRRAALQALQVLEKCEDGSSPHDTAVRACLECWERSLSSDKVRRLALETAVALVGPDAEEVVRFVAKGLEADTDEARAAATEGLALVVDGPTALLVGQLTRRVIDDRAPVRKDAILALRKIIPNGHPMLVEELAQHADKPDVGVRRAVVEALQSVARRGDEAAAQAVDTRLWDQEPSIRVAAVKAIAEVAPFNNDDYITRICLCLEDDDKTVRESVADALPKMSDSRNRTVIQCLTHCIRNTMKYPKRENTREAACRAMAKWAEKGSEEAVYVICGTICQDYPQATVAALRSLPEVARRGDRAALDGAASALAHGERRVRDVAAEVLEQLADRGDVAPASASSATIFEGRWSGGTIKGQKIMWGEGDIITPFEVRPGRVLTTVCTDLKGRSFPAWARLDAYDRLRWDFGADWSREPDPQAREAPEAPQAALQDELNARAAALERQIFGEEPPEGGALSPAPAQDCRECQPSEQEQQTTKAEVGDIYAVATVAAHFKTLARGGPARGVSPLPGPMGREMPDAQGGGPGLLPRRSTIDGPELQALQAAAAAPSRTPRRMSATPAYIDTSLGKAPSVPSRPHLKLHREIVDKIRTEVAQLKGFRTLELRAGISSEKLWDYIQPFCYICWREAASSGQAGSLAEELVAARREVEQLRGQLLACNASAMREISNLKSRQQGESEETPTLDFVNVQFHEPIKFLDDKSRQLVLDIVKVKTLDWTASTSPKKSGRSKAVKHEERSSSGESDDEDFFPNQSRSPPVGSTSAELRNMLGLPGRKPRGALEAASGTQAVGSSQSPEDGPHAGAANRGAPAEAEAGSTEARARPAGEAGARGASEEARRQGLHSRGAELGGTLPSGAGAGSQDSRLAAPQQSYSSKDGGCRWSAPGDEAAGARRTAGDPAGAGRGAGAGAGGGAGAGAGGVAGTGGTGDAAGAAVGGALGRAALGAAGGGEQDWRAAAGAASALRGAASAETVATQTMDEGNSLRELEAENRKLRLAVEEMRTKLREFMGSCDSRGLGVGVSQVADEVGMTALLKTRTRSVFERLYQDALTRPARLEELLQRYFSKLGNSWPGEGGGIEADSQAAARKGIPISVVEQYLAEYPLRLWPKAVKEEDLAASRPESPCRERPPPCGVAGAVDTKRPESAMARGVAGASDTKRPESAMARGASCAKRPESGAPRRRPETASGVPARAAAAACDMPLAGEAAAVASFLQQRRRGQGCGGEAGGRDCRYNCSHCKSKEAPGCHGSSNCPVNPKGAPATTTGRRASPAVSGAASRHGGSVSDGAIFKRRIRPAVSLPVLH